VNTGKKRKKTYNPPRLNREIYSIKMKESKSNPDTESMNNTYSLQFGNRKKSL
jgi:hypothetical protein